MIVVIKFIAPAIEDIPARCKLKIVKSTEEPGCPNVDDNGGYNVQPVPVPVSVIVDNCIKANAGGINQKLILFNLG